MQFEVGRFYLNLFNRHKLSLAGFTRIYPLQRRGYLVRKYIDGMEHAATQSQFDITSKMDFLVPLKQVGKITRAVLESITLFYQPRRIIVVSAKSEGALLAYLLPYWEVGRVEFIDEESYFLKNYNLTLEDILSRYDGTREGDHRESGWWLQQLIKLGACTQVPDISDHYVVWDGKHLKLQCVLLFNDFIRRFGTNATLEALRARCIWKREIFHRHSSR